ncbi:fumarylacetoacetate hydrolase family protein [Dasania sp. GY-MA-18]|uniref:Fumarylacetoacetate hydrolase family protein n=1 Tax=Dasania phycosphaerae TaxID=2950436 RepID=A0A9J6RQE8_9GAMM|nr:MULTISPECIES: fumarylacetoacetate hydrolase family protein [Dasania]MCR8924273.1 fumarylacetoacetate hydrolase family protein [Dasania sp. GY-MA-18]MCZ0866926.1 fumarylacetoacetate hydrolase family protein [Dasania phycosphaerae]MCZ0870430.1 fumarylacetoacetate hydrolase family protein [Dasania phycosphaerae]
MKFLSFEKDGKQSWGALKDDGIVDLGSRVDGDLHEVLKQGKLEAMKQMAAELAADFSAEGIKYLAPITAPEKIACVGVNYANRNAEYKDGSEAPKYPSLFIRTPDSLTGHDLPLIRPPESHQLDYEGEIVLIIGKEGRRIAEEDAYDHIAGITIMNEGTLRDWVRHAKFNVTQGKNFVHSGSIGPWMVTMDEFTEQQLENMRVTTRVNGEVRQDDTTASMMFPFKYIISYFSKFFHLKPGDVIATGTPNGAGARFEPPIYLVPGDVVEVEVEGVGVLSNGIADEVL